MRSNCTDRANKLVTGSCKQELKHRLVSLIVYLNAIPSYSAVTIFKRQLKDVTFHPFFKPQIIDMLNTSCL